jgi:hypothetical protein
MTAFSLASRFDGAERQFGVMLTPGLGAAYPELVRLIGTIYDRRMSKLPWLPSSWLAGVKKLQADYPSDVVRIYPALNAKGDLNDNAPLFLDSKEKQEAWQKIYNDMNAAIMAYAAAKSAEGRGQLARLEADAAFWDASYKIAVFVRDAPGKAIGAVGGGVADFASSLVKGITGKSVVGWLIIAGVAGVALYFYMKPEKFKAIVKGVSGK